MPGCIVVCVTALCRLTCDESVCVSFTVPLEYIRRHGDEAVQPVNSCITLGINEYDTLSVDDVMEETYRLRLSIHTLKCSCTSPILVYLQRQEQQVCTCTH
jgi:hypothetical protein